VLLVLDSNEFIFALGLLPKISCQQLLDTLLSRSPRHMVRIPRTVVHEVVRHLTPEGAKEFFTIMRGLGQIDEDGVVPFELGSKYELRGLKPADAFIAAYTEWVGADALVTENRHFLTRHADLPFRVMTAEASLANISP
jgi:predicted nucleic acid-binding protein